MLCAIWYHLNDLKNVKNTHEGVLLSVKLQPVKHATLLKVTPLHGVFHVFYIVQIVPNQIKCRKKSSDMKSLNSHIIEKMKTF